MHFEGQRNESSHTFPGSWEGVISLIFSFVVGPPASLDLCILF